MAKLELLPRKEFIITLESGEEVKGKYGLWPVKRFCDKHGLSLQQFEQRLTLDKLSISDVIQVILCAVEYKQIKEKQPLKYNDVDVCEWVEELGGLGGEQFKALQSHASSTEEVEGDEKKNHLPTSPGEGSKELASGQA